MVKLSPLFENLSQEIAKMNLAKMNLSVATVFSADVHKRRQSRLCFTPFLAYRIIP